MTTDQRRDYAEAMERASSDFRAADSQEMKAKCPYIFSSNYADAYWISAYALYHTGKLPNFLHKSKGYVWITDISGLGMVRVTIEKADQREGLCVVGNV